MMEAGIPTTGSWFTFSPLTVDPPPPEADKANEDKMTERWNNKHVLAAELFPNLICSSVIPNPAGFHLFSTVEKRLVVR